MLPLQTRCRACGSKSLFDVQNFGDQVPANAFSMSVADPGERFPLLFRVCEACGLGQLGHVVPKEKLYEHYLYVTSTSKTMAAHLDAQCASILDRNRSTLPHVVEIGSNTGEYLKRFKAVQCEIFGFEPAMNLANQANLAGVPTMHAFFTPATATQHAVVHGKADVVIGRHVFAHIDDWQGFIKALDAILAPGGTVVLEVPYLVEMFEKYEFDTIYHEHLSYVSVRAMEALFKNSPFFIHGVERCKIHGGSAVFYLRRKEREARCSRDSMLEHLLLLEEKLGLTKPEVWEEWATMVRSLQEEIAEVVRARNFEGFACYGASAKGSMLLQFVGLGKRDIQLVADCTKEKQGRYMPGTGIPITPPEALEELVKRKEVRNVLLTAWNFGEEIRKNNAGLPVRWVTPLPSVRIE